LEEFVHSQRQINELVDQERAKMIEEGKEPRIALMGFSQGALSLTAIMRTIVTGL